LGSMSDKEYEAETERIYKSLGLTPPGAMMRYLEKSWRKERESQPINLNTTISAGLNKYPSEWINGVCKAIGISTEGKKRDKVSHIRSKLTAQLTQTLEKIPTESLDALRLVIDSCGWMRYNQLSKKYGDEENDSYWWETEPPKSVIGILRLHGLLFVGKAGLKGRMYKVAVVPKEFREQVQKMLK
jgi:hypothetical protein